MRFPSFFSRTKTQQKRSHVIASAATLENLENRTLMSAFFVSPTGSDSAAGSIGAPLKTIQYAINKAHAGDTINLRGGTYNLSSSLSITKGLTIQGYGSETARIVAPTTNSGIENAINVGSTNNVKLVHLDISGGYYYTVKDDGGDNLLISSCKVHDSGRDVIKLTPGSDHSLIQKSEIYNSGRRDSSNAEGIDAVNANYAILRDSYIHDTTTNGVYYKGGSVKTLIERNRITRAGFSGILLGQSTDPEFFNDATNPSHYESIDGIVRNNIIWDVEGAGVGAWGALRPRIYNNTMYNVAQSYFGGLLVQGEGDRSSTDVSLYNNIVVVAGNRPALDVRDGGLTGYLKSDYNIYYRMGGGAAQINDEVHGYSGTLAGWKAKGHDTHSLATNPGLNAARNYHLTSTSAAVNRGLTLTAVPSDFDRQARPAGGRTDIGADEYRA